MTKTQYLLGQLAEEASEIAQVSIKGIRFGLEDRYPLTVGKTVLEKLNGEISDLVGVIAELDLEIGNGPSLRSALKNSEAILAKRLKVKSYMQYSKDLGILK